MKRKSIFNVEIDRDTTERKSSRFLIFRVRTHPVHEIRVFNMNSTNS